MRLPDLQLYDHQESVPLDLARLSALARQALPLVLAQTGAELPVLPGLHEIEVSFVTGAEIAAVHGRFLQDDSPTDVITFDHGEILVSTCAAAAAAPSWGHCPGREALLYIIHGLLHLNGHEDTTDAGAAAMKQCQETILAAVWPPGAGEIENAAVRL